MSAKYIVVFDDDQSFCIPMMWDTDCHGALVAVRGGGAIVLFNDRADARRAIRISAAYAKLRKEQGFPANEDFLSARSCVKVVPCVESSASQIEGPK